MKSLLLPKALIGLSLFITINTAHAENFSYNYIEGGLNHYLGDAEDVTSFKVDGSLGVTENLHLLAGIQSDSIDVNSINATLNQYKIGAGIHSSVNPGLDLIAEIGLINAELSASGYNSVSQNAIMVGAGLRQQLTDKIEGHAKMNLYSVEDSDSELEKEFTFGGRLHINEQVSGGLDYTKQDGNSEGVLTTSIRLQSL
ncbi:MAG: hypothetical protein E6Q83_12655 [Thiothrix sp.]|nr:MAG: hypothetical protein E6Q83_12655 [Thiothrix sp.]